jgi:GNAT superfamily N-acetyltransferase
MAIDDEPGVLNSWMGGVVKRFRRKGIASQLMQAQHHWAKSRGYRLIRTKSTNLFVPMIKLNLSHGFIMTGTEQDKDRLKVVMECRLDSG